MERVVPLQPQEKVLLLRAVERIVPFGPLDDMKTATARKGMYSPKAFSMPKAPAPTKGNLLKRSVHIDDL